MDRRREKGLCFKCGLIGHRANSHYKNQTLGRGSWKGNKKQVSALRRSGYEITNVNQPEAPVTKQISMLKRKAT